MMASNFIILAFYIIETPSTNVINNIVNMLIELCYIGLELCIIVYVNKSQITS